MTAYSLIANIIGYQVNNKIRRELKHEIRNTIDSRRL
jgi:hypothetical protein